MDTIDLRFEKSYNDMYFALFESKESVFLNKIALNGRYSYSELFSLSKSCGKIEKIETAEYMSGFTVSVNRDKIYYFSQGNSLDSQINCNVINISSLEESFLFSKKNVDNMNCNFRIATEKYLIIKWEDETNEGIIQFYDLKKGISYEVEEKKLALEGILEILAYEEKGKTWYLFKTGTSITPYEKEHEVNNPIYNIEYREGIKLISEECIEKYLDRKQKLVFDTIFSIEQEGCIKSLWVIDGKIIYDVIDFNLQLTEVNCIDIHSRDVFRYEIKKDYYRIVPGNGYLYFLETEFDVLKIYNVEDNCLLHTINSKSRGYFDFLGMCENKFIVSNTRKEEGKLKNYIHIYDKSNGSTLEYDAQAFFDESGKKLYLY